MIKTSDLVRAAVEVLGHSDFGLLRNGEEWRLTDPNDPEEAPAFTEHYADIEERVAEISAAAAIDDYRIAIERHVDAVAQSRNYSGGVSLASYVASTNQVWAAEAQAFVAWRDGVWAYAYAELDKVQNGQRPQPTVEEFIDELDPIVWP